MAQAYVRYQIIPRITQAEAAGMAAERDELPLSAHAAGMIAAVESENCPKNVTDYRGVTFDPTRV